MDKVEKVARAIYEARGAHEPPRAWRKWEDIGDEARAVWCQCATAALAVMGEREAVGFFATLTPVQQAAALAYRGPENLMPSDAPISPRPEAVEVDTTDLNDEGSWWWAPHVPMEFVEIWGTFSPKQREVIKELAIGKAELAEQADRATEESKG